MLVGAPSLKKKKADFEQSMRTATGADHEISQRDFEAEFARLLVSPLKVPWTGLQYSEIDTNTAVFRAHLPVQIDQQMDGRMPLILTLVGNLTLEAKSRIPQAASVGLRFACVFFFQAEDGIRDDLVTGVQTCALPILELMPEQRVPVRSHRDQPVDGVPGASLLVAQQLGHQLQGLLELRVEVVLGERQLGRGDRKSVV